jgi:hypothetical protein
VLLPRLEVGEEGVVVELDISEEHEVVAPVRSLLLCGRDGDCIGLGRLCSQVSSLEHSAGGKGEMLKPGGTWSRREEASKEVSSWSGKSVSRDNESDTAFCSPGNQWLTRPQFLAITNVANSRAISSCIGWVVSSKFDFRIHPAPEVLSV